MRNIQKILNYPKRNQYRQCNQLQTWKFLLIICISWIRFLFKLEYLRLTIRISIFWICNVKSIFFISFSLRSISESLIFWLNYEEVGLDVFWFSWWLNFWKYSIMQNNIPTILCAKFCIRVFFFSDFLEDANIFFFKLFSFSKKFDLLFYYRSIFLSE